MEHDVTPFWAEIKKYEDTLAKDPASYCFVQLAELYRKSGLLDDAILVAQKGCDTHPDYVGGFMALGRAFFDKGLSAESRTALEKVIGLTPDNLLARRLLAQIYAGAGETAAAEESLRFILAQNPADPECQALLDSLHSAERPDESVQVETRSENSGAGVASAPDDLLFELCADDGEIIEDAELLEELTEVALPEENADTVAFQPVQSALDTPLVEVDEDIGDETAEETDPLVTATMAELYASQGFLKRALTIYRGLLEADPDNAEWNNRLYELKMAIDEDTEIARHVVSSGMNEEDVSRVSEEIPDVAPSAGKGAPAPLAGSVVDTLEAWLDTIRRRR